MPLSQRSQSLNMYCLIKVWCKCPSIELRVSDLTKISSLIKSWLFQDQLEKPEDHVLYRSRTQGGLSLTNVKVKALSLLIKTFLETALSDKFQKNLFHEAIFRWHVLKERDLVKPKLPPYYSEEMLDLYNNNNSRFICLVIRHKAKRIQQVFQQCLPILFLCSYNSLSQLLRDS